MYLIPENSSDTLSLYYIFIDNWVRLLIHRFVQMKMYFINNITMTK